MPISAQVKDAVLDLWKAGHNGSLIPDLAAEQGLDVTVGQVRNIVKDARQKNDKRAVRRTNAVYGN